MKKVITSYGTTYQYITSFERSKELNGFISFTQKMRGRTEEKVLIREDQILSIEPFNP